MQYIIFFTTYQFYYLIFHFFNHCTVHINLIDNGNYLKVIINSEVQIRNRLCLYSLCSIYQQQATLTGSQCTAHFITKVHVAGSINQVQYVLLPVSMFIINLDSMTFNSNALFSFQIHIVQHLVHHITVADGAGALQQPVSQCRFAVVYMCDNAKIADVLHVRFTSFFRWAKVADLSGF